MVSYTLADLARRTGAKRRTVQLWAEAGVIKADSDTERAGTGTHRRFSYAEAIIACLMVPFALRQMSVGELLKTSDAIRRFLRKGGSGKTAVDEVIRGSGLAYLTMTTWGDEYEAAIHVCDKPEHIGETLQGIGERAVKHLEYRGAMTMVVRLNTYLEKLD